MRSTLLTLTLLLSLSASAQWRAGIFAGGASYLGELNDKPFARTKPAIGGSLSYEFANRLALRTNLTIGTLEGGDQWSGDEFKRLNRNLSFRTNIVELSLVGELTLFNMENMRWSPYGYAGLAVFRFNPYMKVGSEKVYLQPLGTEGQGIPGAPGQTYQLTQFAIPVAGGIKFDVTENLRLGFELGLRRTFTDYLDDISTGYADAAQLLSARGPQAVAYSYRGDEVPGSAPGYPDAGYPDKGAIRGNPTVKDFYYFTGLHLAFRIGGGYGKTSSSGRGQYGCPRI